MSHLYIFKKFKLRFFIFTIFYFSAKDEGPKVNLTGRTMSSSCPDLTLPAQSSNSSMSSVSSSLPDQLDTKCVFDNFSATATTSATKNFLAPPIPATPPPSEADDLGLFLLYASEIRVSVLEDSYF